MLRHRQLLRISPPDSQMAVEIADRAKSKVYYLLAATVSLLKYSFSNFPPHLPAADRAMQNTVEHLIEPDLGMVHENQ